jgi:hypothetical protein
VGELAGVVGAAVAVEDDRLAEPGDVQAANPATGRVLDLADDRVLKGVAMFGDIVGVGGVGERFPG